MADCGQNENYDGYIPQTVDPGPALLVATLLFCVLLITLLPYFVACGKKWKKRRKKAVETDSSEDDEKGDEDDESSDDDEGNVDKKKRTEKRKVADDASESSSDSDDSARTGISSVANSLLNAILDSAPRGGPNMRQAKLALLHRDQVLEVEERFDRDMTEMSLGGGSKRTRGEQNDNHSVGTGGGNGSVLGKLDYDAVSVQDAVDANNKIYTTDDAIAIVQGSGNEKKPSPPCCSPAGFAYGFDKLLVIAEWDTESRRICKLGLPFMIQSLLVGVAETVRIAIIGRLLGTTMLSAYIVVDLVVGVTTEFMRGFQDALITLCSQALGAENNVLTGQYVQMTVTVYTIMYIPIFVFWYIFVKPTMLWFGLDEATAEAGQDFAILLLLASLLHGLDESVHALLDCIGCENYSTVFTVSTEMLTTVGIYFEARSSGASLQGIGYVFVGVHGVALVLNVVIVLWNGWLDPYLEGIIGTFAIRNGKGFRLLLTTASTLSFGYLLTNGEWEILTFFAGFLGTAEVAAWGILGSLWEALEVVTTAIGNAAEVRVSYLLGSGRPREARLSAYKSLYLGMFATLMITSCLFIAGDQIPTWMTADKTLQHMISDLMPLFGIGNISMAIGSMSWTLVGAQGRYRLSTAVGFAGSWFVTIPLSAIFSIVLKFDLQGQTAAIVFGYMVSGTINFFILMQSNWEKLSRKVIAYNAEHGIVESGSEDESSSEEEGSGSSDDDDDEDGDDDGEEEESSSESEPAETKTRPDPLALYSSKTKSK